MTNGLSLNMQLLQDLAVSSGFNNNHEQNTKSSVYAKEGDAKYNEAMDYDSDGVVTSDEYQRYRRESGINTENQIQSVQGLGDSMIARRVSESKGASNSEMPYDDYIKYCEENAVSRPSTQAAIKPENIETNEAGLIIHNFGRALNSYSRSSISFPEPKIERNA